MPISLVHPPPECRGLKTAGSQVESEVDDRSQSRFGFR